jgi:hypothetical protein
MSAPWGNPPPPDRRGYQDFIGRPVITIVGGVRFNVPSQYGARDLPHVSIVSLVGPDAGVVYTDIIVWTSRIAGRLKASEPGAVILSKVIDKGKAPDIEDPDQWDQQAATAWFNANPGALEALKHGAVTDFRNYVAQNGNGASPHQTQPYVSQYQQAPVNPAYQQPQYAPQSAAGVGIVGQAIAQPPGYYPQPEQPAQPQYQAPGPQHQAQLRQAEAGPPPDQPPPAFYGPPPTQSVESARNTQSDEAPF